MQSVIIDDDELFCQYFQDNLKKWSQEISLSLKTDIVNKVTDISQLSDSYDVYFIDIEMPEMTGLELVAKFHKLYVNAEFIFVSAYDHYLTEAFFVKPSGFIRKDFLEKDTKRVLEYLIEQEKKKTQKVTVREGKRSIDIYPQEIIYFRNVDHYLAFVCKDGSVSTYRLKLDLVERVLQRYDFVRIHNRYLINLQWVVSFQDEKVLMSDGTYLPISRSRKRETERALINWFRNKKN